MVHNKCLPLLLKALADLHQSLPYELRVTGDGPQRERLGLLAKHLGIDKHIQWLGWITAAEYNSQHAWADVFVFTSLRDALGHVVLGAIGHSLPVICLDHSGAHDAITSDCGIKIPATSGYSVIKHLRAAILEIGNDHILRRRLSIGAFKRAQMYLWSANAKHMADIITVLSIINTEAMP